MNYLTKTALILTLLTGLGISGAAIVANARDTTIKPVQRVQMSQRPDSEDTENGEDEEREMDEAAEEAEKMKQYEALAQITPQQAQQTAEAAQGDTATEVELDIEDGSLVYEVEFNHVEVVVDAGNGQILRTEREGEEEDDTTEVPIRGSIQVPHHDSH